jgi:hypothetical protein
LTTEPDPCAAIFRTPGPQIDRPLLRNSVETTLLTLASSILRGTPGRGSSSSPSRPRSAKRPRHLPTVCTLTRSRANALSLSPAAALFGPARGPTRPRSPDGTGAGLIAGASRTDRVVSAGRAVALWQSFLMRVLPPRENWPGFVTPSPADFVRPSRSRGWAFLLPKTRGIIDHDRPADLRRVRCKYRHLLRAGTELRGTRHQRHRCRSPLALRQRLRGRRNRLPGMDRRASRDRARKGSCDRPPDNDHGPVQPLSGCRSEQRGFERRDVTRGRGGLWGSTGGRGRGFPSASAMRRSGAGDDDCRQRARGTQCPYVTTSKRQSRTKCRFWASSLLYPTHATPTWARVTRHAQCHGINRFLTLIWFASCWSKLSGLAPPQ